MIKQIRVLYWASLTTLCLIAVLGTLVFLFVQNSSPTQVELARAANPNNIKGWAWSGTANAASVFTGGVGWISLNSQNCVDLNQITPGYCELTPGIDYGLSLIPNDYTSGTVQGFAWYGPPVTKLCQGGVNDGKECSSDDDCTGGTCEFGGGLASRLDRAGTWICFGSACEGTGNPVGDSPPGNDDPTINFSINCTGSIDEGTLVCENEGHVVSGWAKILSEPAGQGWISLTSLNCDALGPSVCGDTDSSYGLSLNLDSSTISGFAWQTVPSASPALSYGGGWICFGGDICGYNPDVVFPYLRAEGGDVFSLKGIQTFFPAPTNIRNAQFLIHTGEGSQISSRFTSECQNYASDPAICRTAGMKLELSETPADSSEPYNFKLGRFDFKGLATPVGSTDTNKYKFQVVSVPVSSDSIVNIFSQPLNSKVYVIGDLDILTPTDPLTIPDPADGAQAVISLGTALGVLNGTDATSGAGTIIVLGDLKIERNITYQPVTASLPRKNLASVVWIVLGDVEIDPEVTEVAGSFIVLGHRWYLGQTLGCYSPVDTYKILNKACTAEADCQYGLITGTCQEMPKCQVWQGDNVGLSSGCGLFKTGVSATQSLIVRGTAFARQFKLERTYIDINNPTQASEKFIADGRLQLNPPPGMADLSKGLPTFSRR